jgi:lysyl-tRNA synthetase class 2
MLEFYQSYSDYRDLMDLTEELIKQLAQNVLGKIEFEFEGQPFRRQLASVLSERGHREFCRRLSSYCSASDLSLKACQHLPGAGMIMPAQVSGNGSAIAYPQGVLGMLFEAVAERHLIQPTTIYDYPIEPHHSVHQGQRSSSSSASSLHGRHGDRYAYSELNDPEEQKRRLNCRWRSARKAMTRRTR